MEVGYNSFIFFNYSPFKHSYWVLEFKEVFHSVLEFDKQYLFYIYLSWSGVS